MKTTERTKTAELLLRVFEKDLRFQLDGVNSILLFLN